MSSSNLRDVEDLSALVRRGHASREQERDLRRALERDAGLGLAHQVGLDFDGAGAVQAGDEQLIARAADAALERVAPAALGFRLPLLGRWQQVAAIALFCSLCCSGVGAALWVAGVNPLNLLPAPAAQPEAPVALAPAKRAQPRRAPQQMIKESSPAPELVPPEAAPVSPVRASRTQARAANPAELFHAASRARRAGDLAEARRLYETLIARAPDSDEAHVAHVSLGKLLLGAGQSRAAERAFQRYLVRGGGALGEEALFGRAESLSRLGRTKDEAAAWRALLGAYPESVYAARAKERLNALAPADAKDPH